MFSNFYSVKNHKINNNSSTTEAKQKISKVLEFVDFYVCLANFKSNKILLNKLATDIY